MRAPKLNPLQSALITLVLVAGLVVFVDPAGAVHDEGFDLQGDVYKTSANYDWVDLFDSCATTDPCTPPASTGSGLPDGFIRAAFTTDYVEPDPSAYATGTKDTLRIGDGSDGNPATGTSAWQCKSSNNLGPKFDLVNAYAAAMRTPVKADGKRHLIVYFGSEIYSPNGDRNAGVWLLQDGSVGCTGSGNTNFAGTHRNGDVFVVSAFTNGGTKSNVTVYQWVGNDATGSLQLKFSTGELNDAECDNSGINNAPNLDRACAIVNKSSEVDPPWTAPDSDGGDLNVNEFYEGAIDLTALELPECFATIVANSRSSQSPGSTLHDFAVGSFPTCNPSTTMKNTAATASPSTVHAGDSVTLTFYEKNDGDVALTSPSVTTDDAGGCATTTYSSGDANTNSVLDPGEEWAFTCTTSFSTLGSHTVTAIGHGTGPTGEVTYCPTPDSTKVCNANETTNVSITVINPSTKLTKTASAVITYTFKEENDGDVALSSPTVTDPGCDSPPAYQSGDTSPANSMLDPGETWIYTCTATLNGPTTDTGTASVTNSGIGDGVDSAGKNVTYCETPDATKVCKANERDRVTVTITNLARG